MSNAPTSEEVCIAVPLELYTLVLFAGFNDMLSTPTGSPVRFKNNLSTVSPPVNAPALPSDVLSFFLILLIVALVATPPLRANENVKSDVASAPEPLLAL